MSCWFGLKTAVICVMMRLVAFLYPNTSFHCELGWAMLWSAWDLCYYNRQAKHQWGGCKLFVESHKNSEHWLLLYQHKPTFKKYLLLNIQVTKYSIIATSPPYFSLCFVLSVMDNSEWRLLPYVGQTVQTLECCIRLAGLTNQATVLTVMSFYLPFWLKLNACHRDVPLAASERSWKLSSKKLQYQGFVLLMWLGKGTRHPGSKFSCPC